MQSAFKLPSDLPVKSRAVQKSQASRHNSKLITRALEGRLAYYLAGALGLVLHLSLSLPLYRWHDRLLAFVPLVILLILLRDYVKQDRKGIPVLLLVAVQIYIFYSVPQFSQEGMILYIGYYEPSSYALSMAMLLVVLGELLFILGYQFATSISGRFSTLFYRINPTPSPDWALVTLLYSLITFPLFALTALRPEYIPVSVRFLMGQLLNVYLGLTLLLYLGYLYQKKILLIAAYFIAAGIGAVGLIQGMLGTAVSPFFILFLTRWAWGRVLGLRWVIIVVLAIVIINPVKYTYRNLSWTNMDISTVEGVQERIENWFVAFDKVWIQGDIDESVLTSTANRTSDLIPFAQAIDYVPTLIPYLSGEGLDEAILFWVPRIILPSKGSSTDLVYTRYAVDFGYLDYEGTKFTTVGASLFVEGYWNFGVYGVLGFSLALGLLLGMLFGNNGKNEKISMLICAVYLAPNIFVLQALSLTLASMFSFVIGITIALWGIWVCSRFINLSPMSYPSRLG